MTPCGPGSPASQPQRTAVVGPGATRQFLETVSVTVCGRRDLADGSRGESGDGVTLNSRSGTKCHQCPSRTEEGSVTWKRTRPSSPEPRQEQRSRKPRNASGPPTPEGVRCSFAPH